LSQHRLREGSDFLFEEHVAILHIRRGIVRAGGREDNEELAPGDDNEKGRSRYERKILGACGRELKATAVKTKGGNGSQHQKGKKRVKEKKKGTCEAL